MSSESDWRLRRGNDRSHWHTVIKLCVVVHSLKQADMLLFALDHFTFILRRCSTASALDMSKTIVMHLQKLSRLWWPLKMQWYCAIRAELYVIRSAGRVGLSEIRAMWDVQMPKQMAIRSLYDYWTESSSKSNICRPAPPCICYDVILHLKKSCRLRPETGGSFNPVNDRMYTGSFNNSYSQSNQYAWSKQLSVGFISWPIFFDTYTTKWSIAY